jgi:peptidoglycan hydrolase-like protein with peptidoglycan-binding domain
MSQPQDADELEAEQTAERVKSANGEPSSPQSLRLAYGGEVLVHRAAEEARESELGLDTGPAIKEAKPPSAGTAPSEGRLESPFWADDERLQAAYHNSPPLHSGDTGRSVTRLQEALVSQGYAMPSSTKRDGSLDGIWGSETTSTVRAFQQQHGVRPVGGWEAGHKTLGALDRLLPRRGDQPQPSSDYGAGMDTEEMPVLAAAPSTASLAFAVPGGPTPGGAAGSPDVGVKKAGAVSVPFQNSLHESIFAVVQWLASGREVRAAAAVNNLLSNPDTKYFITLAGKIREVERPAYEYFARQNREVILGSGAIEFLIADLGVTRSVFDAAAQSEKQNPGLLSTADEWRFFGQPNVPLDPKGTAAESRKAGEKRTPVEGDDSYLLNPQIAKLYLTLMKAKVGLGVDESKIHPEDGLDRAEIKAVIGNDSRRQYLTDLFTQGVKEYEAGGGTDISKDFLLLEGALWDQVLWGNPTATKNELKVSMGWPERDLGIGLAYRPDGMLYYTPDGDALPSLTGSGYRDPGYKGTAKDPGFINLYDIGDETLRGFLKLLHDNFKEPTLIIAKGAEAYWKNLDDVNAMVRSGLSDAIKDELENALKVLIGFLLWKAASFALTRQPHPWLKAIGFGMEGLAEGAGYALQIDFVGSVEARLVKAGVHLAKVVPKDESGNLDPYSQLEMSVAAGEIRPIIAEIAAMLILKVGEKMVKGPKPKAKAEFEAITSNSKRARLQCSFCQLVEEAAEFSKEQGKRIYEQARQTRNAKPGEVLHGSGNYSTIEMHPDGNIFGEHGELKKFLQEAKMSGRERGTFHSHHLMEDHQMRRFGVDEDKGWAVALEAEEHSTFSSWMKGIREPTTDIDELYKTHSQMYQFNGHPEYVKRMREFLLNHRDDIRKRYKEGDVPSGKQPDFAERKERAIKFLDSL